VHAADRVVHHVDAARSLGAQPLAQVVARVVDQHVRAALAARRALLVARGRGDDARARQLAELDGREPDAPARPEHQQRLARAQFGAIAQRIMGGAIGGEQPRGDHVAHSVGDRDEFTPQARVETTT
jgi:hypothetical protein